MSRKRKTFNAEFKSKVVLELLSGEMTVAQLASKYEITPKSIGDWKRTRLWHLISQVQQKHIKKR